MSEQSITKEVIVRGVLASLNNVQHAPMVDPGQLVLSLEKEPSEWCHNNVIDVSPLWRFFVADNAWSEENFQFLLLSLQQLLAHKPVQWEFSPPSQDEPSSNPEEAVETTPVVHATATEVFLSQRQLLINWMVGGVRDSAVQRIVDPSKMRQFLDDSIDELFEEDAVQLDYLWDILNQPDAVTTEMAVGTFLILENSIPEELAVAIVWPKFFVDFMSKLSVAQRISFYKSMGLEPPQALIQVYSNSMQMPSTGSFSSFGEMNSISADMSAPSMQGISQTRTGSQPAFDGRQTGASYQRKKMSSALKTQSTKKGKKDKKKKQRQRKSPHSRPQLNVPIWAVVVTFLVVLGGAAYYFLVVPASLPGYQMNVNAYSQYMPLQDLRINNSTVQVMPKKDFFLNTDNVQSTLLKTLYDKIKYHNGFVVEMAVYSYKGRFLKFFKPAQPVVPPKGQSRASAPNVTR